MNRFDRVIEGLPLREGIYSKDPNDRGNWTGGRIGAGVLKGTKYGISAASYPNLDIDNLTWSEARAIYRRDFWDVLQCDELGAPLDDFLFDFAVNSGAQRVAGLLQSAVGTIRDGIIGPKTIAAYLRRSPRDVLRALFVERAMIFALDPTDRYHGRGWFARLFDVLEPALLDLHTPAAPD